MATSPGGFTMGVARADHFHPLMDFLERNEAASLPLPTAPTLKDAIATGSVYVATADGGAIAACAGCFDLCTGADRKDLDLAEATDVLELAGTRVTSAAGGLEPLSMQECLLSLRIVGALIARDEQFDPRACFVAATLSTANRSRATLERNGFHEVEHPPRWLRLEQRSWTASAGVRYFVLSGDMVGMHARRVLQFATRPLTLKRTGGEGHAITWDVPWFDWALEAVRTLVGEYAGIGGVPEYRRLAGDDVI